MEMPYAKQASLSFKLMFAKLLNTWNLGTQVWKSGKSFLNASEK